MSTPTENPGAIIVHVLEHNRMVGPIHRRGYIVVGKERRLIPIMKCEANGWRACQGHGVRAAA